MSKSNISVFVADLTHTSQGIAALTFPLGTGFVVSYAKAMCGEAFSFRLFKFPEILAAAIIETPPDILALSNYAWNLDIGIRFARRAREINPNLIVILGGPNFPVTTTEKRAWLSERPEVDFFIQNEGEVAFATLLHRLLHYGLDSARLKKSGETINNCNWLCVNNLIEGEIARISNISMIPSPYLTGTLDAFFDTPLIPMLETTRGCPFTCTFCADGISSKSRIERFDNNRIRDELDYIAGRIKKIDELIITDLNFGMYKEDLHTAEYIAEIQDGPHKWPKLVGASAGKNKPDIVLKVADILKGTWGIGSAMQSSDSEVLKNVMRSNISIDAYQKFVDHSNKLSRDTESYSEIILALPGDTKEKHFQSLRSAINGRVSTLRMYQAIVLSGTSMATPETRAKFGLQTKFRVMPGCAGIYKFGKAEVVCAEIEEIIVGCNSMSFDDYVACRVMNLFIESYINNAMFEEIFIALRMMNIETFDCLLYMFNCAEFWPEKISTIIDSFVDGTISPLFSTKAEAQSFVCDPNNVIKYVSKELGRNELLDHRAELYLAIDDMSNLLLKAVIAMLEERNEATASVRLYLTELVNFILCRKKNFHNCDKPFEVTFHYDFDFLEANNFEIHPRDLERRNEIKFRFLTDSKQRQLIENAKTLYCNHPGGLGRMIQRSNLKKMYRQVERI